MGSFEEAILPTRASQLLLQPYGAHVSHERRGLESFYGRFQYHVLQHLGQLTVRQLETSESRCSRFALEPAHRTAICFIVSSIVY